MKTFITKVIKGALVFLIAIAAFFMMYTVFAGIIALFGSIAGHEFAVTYKEAANSAVVMVITFFIWLFLVIYSATETFETFDK